MLERLERLLQSKQLAEPERRTTLDTIFGRLLGESATLNGANFTSIHPHDLSRAFGLYDDLVFESLLRPALAGRHLAFKLSRRMTSAGGHTVRYRSRVDTSEWFEIGISVTLLFNTFYDVERSIIVNGLVCENRLQAMLRVFEHELIHLAEMMVWGDSSCSARRFQGIAERLFGHREHKHQLVTPTERAAKRFGVRTGDEVVFRFEGRQYTGRVNRINKRATILVEDAAGEPYSDGKHYRKYYVPLSLLQKQSP